MNMRMLSLLVLLLMVSSVQGNAEKDFYRLKLNEAKKKLEQVERAREEALRALWQQEPEGKKYKEIKGELFTSCPRHTVDFDDKCSRLYSDFYDSWAEVETTEYYNTVYRPLLISGAYQFSLVERLTNIVNAVEDNKNDDPTINKIICKDIRDTRYFVPNYRGTPEVIKIKDFWIGEDKATDELRNIVKEAKACILREEEDIKNLQQQKIKQKMRNKKFFALKGNVSEAVLYEARKNKQNAEGAEQRAMQRLLKTEQGCEYKERNDILCQYCPGNPNNWDDRCKNLYSQKNDSLEKLKNTEEYNTDYRRFVVDLAFCQTFEHGLTHISDAIIIHDLHANAIIGTITDENKSILGLTSCGEIPERMEIEDFKTGRDKGNAALEVFVKKIIDFKKTVARCLVIGSVAAFVK